MEDKDKLIAELKAENMEIKTSYINFIAKLKREMITKDDIQDLKDTAKRFVEERNSLRKENAALKAENERLTSCLQEIKEIADVRCNECKYGKDGISCKYGDCGEAKLHLITQLITKAESEE